MDRASQPQGAEETKRTERVELSVVVATLEAGPDTDVARALESQSFTDYEVLFRDDYPVTKARNEGIREAAADKIVFLVDDSRPRPGYLRRAADLTADEGRYESHWQAIAVRLFHERYSNWLLTGIGENLVRARANPTDPDAQRPLWDPDRRRSELLTLLNVVRNESHRDVITTALAVSGGDSPDHRTESVRETVESLLEWTER
jgi:glycosyltransferase involved in cell wall biosynthesis